jgi:acetylornithine/succinyldiaminopimelate/putrescine aminotransferase/predicted amino acid dehydrogenase
MTDLAQRAEDGRGGYGEHLKPGVHELLRAVGLDVVYQRAEGDRLTYRDGEGRDREVLDALGGYGASLFGHNHPRLLDRAMQVLAERRAFLAQGSVRGLAGSLAAKLSELAGRSTGRSYVVTLAATGADAVEAAIKHAEMELVLRIERIVEENNRAVSRYLQRQRDGEPVSVAEGFFARASAHFGKDVPEDVEIGSLVEAALGRTFADPPTFFALEGAFHGKSTGALSLTANAKFREPWARVALRTRFLPIGDEATLREAIASLEIPHLLFTISDAGELDVTERKLANVAACFCEPIQGEGGVREIPADYLRALRRHTEEARIPLVMDEIQSGMGRTGTFFASEPTGVRADYYTLSKSLGGSLAKISALLVDRERSLRDFGVLHTSTFADDDFACTVALEALALLEENDGALVRACRDKGAFLLERLADVKRRYPDQIREVRGRGLMVGVEFASQNDSPSPFLRLASEQGLIGYVLASYMFHGEGIRIAPTLSAPTTLRIQPSAGIAEADLERIVGAVERAAELLRVADAGAFARAMLGRPRTTKVEPVQHAPADAATAGERPARKVAFLGHFLEDGDVRDWDPSFADFSDADCAELLSRTRGILHPYVLKRQTLRAPGAEPIELTVIGVPFTSSQVMDSFKRGETSWMRDEVHRAVDVAKEHGCSIIGFGGYTSIVTDNCRTVGDATAAVTTGNALTAAAAVLGLVRAAERMKLGPLRLGVVGALGNIGSVLAELLVDHVERVVLVGRSGARRRLEDRARELRLSVLRHFVLEGVTTGLPGVFGATSVGRVLAGARELVHGTEPSGSFSDKIGDFVRVIAAGAALDFAAAALRSGASSEASAFRSELEGAVTGIDVSTDLEKLRDCNVIVTASNSPKPLLLPQHFAAGPVLVCDVATPGDVDDSVARECPNVSILPGGMLRLPLEQSLRLPGMPGEGRQTFGCLAETLLLGFEGATSSFAVGKLSPEIVRRAARLADDYGFVIEDKAGGAGS